MSRVVINSERCKGCELCVEVCLKNVLGPAAEINQRGIYPVEVKNPEECTGCKLCAVICPDVAITIYENI